MLEKIANKDFYIASAITALTGILDCYFTSIGLDEGIIKEGNFFYSFLHNNFGAEGLYLGKILTTSLLTSICERQNNILTMDIASLFNSFGFASGGLSYAYFLNNFTL